MGFYAGLSGWAYPEWRGSFYPAGLSMSRMLAAYAHVFDTVEVNNTFYRIPKPEAFTGWCSQVPSTFRFSFKAPRAITHRRCFAEGTEVLDRFAGLLAGVGPRLGPVLFQFDTIADVPQLAEFLGMAAARFPRVAVEFRHPSWLTEATYDVLRAADVAMCQTETDAGSSLAVGAKRFTYLRLRKSVYTAAELEERLAALSALASPEHEVFAYLKHDANNAVLLRQLGAGTSA